MTGTYEEDRAELKRIFENIHKKNTDPNTVEDMAYKMRFAKGGVVWHSWVDPNRPESPPVEWPEYPKDKRPSDLPEDGIMSRETDPKVLAAAARSSAKSNPIKPKMSGADPCAVGKVKAPIEDPDDADDMLESIESPKYRGLYSERGRWGGDGLGLPGYDQGYTQGYDPDDTSDGY